MEVGFAQATAFVGSLLWPMMRIGAMLLAMPVLGTRLMPTRVKIITTFVLAITVLPLLPDVPEVEALSLQGMLISVQAGTRRCSAWIYAATGVRGADDCR